MPRYGFCSQCGRSVWLDGDGSCPDGHGPESISGVTDTYPAGPLPAPVKKSNALLIVAAIVLPLLLLVCGTLTAIAVPVFNAGSESAREQACFSYQRVMEGGYMQWLASSEANTPDLIADYPTLEATLLSQAIIPEPPVCPSGGEYRFADGVVTCSIHDHY